jgi:hypothetical protein
MSFGLVAAGSPIRDTWWCSYCKEEFDEPKGAHYFAPVVYGIDARYGVQSKRCHCGRKLRRLTS